MPIGFDDPCQADQCGDPFISCPNADGFHLLTLDAGLFVAVKFEAIVARAEELVAFLDAQLLTASFQSRITGMH